MGTRKIVRKTLTDVGIRAAIAGAKKDKAAQWITDGAILKGKGGLQLFLSPAGIGRWYWRYSAPDGKKVRLPLGPLALTPTPGSLTLPEARDEVNAKAALYAQPESRDVRAFEEAERQRIAAENAAAEALHFAQIETETLAAVAAARERESADKHTLERLYAAYITHLRKQGKQSAYDAESLFAVNILRPHPELANKQAREITRAEVVAILREVVESGRGRTAAKLRAYLRACYALAVRAESSADVPAAFIAFAVAANPAADTASLASFNRALDRALSEPELREFWTAVKALPDGPVRDAMMLLLLTGGQRPTQLTRATVADVDEAAHTLVLRDPKGRRQQARVHVLPLVGDAVAVVGRCLDRAKAHEAKRGDAERPRYLFSTHGTAPLHPQSLTAAVRDICADLMAKDKSERVIQAAFGLRDIRRTCETRLAALGISKDTRAQLQSHGLGGVQGRHYDKHDYAEEKRAALEAWAAFLETKPAENVRQIKRGQAAA